MQNLSQRRSTSVRILGARSTGVTIKVAQALGQQIKGAYQRHGQKVRLKGMRFIPSSLVELGNGRFEVLANTVIEVAASGGRPSRSEAVDSVVTIDRESAGQVLKDVKIPALDRAEQASRLAAAS